MGNDTLAQLQGTRLFGRSLSLVVSSPDVPSPLVDGKFNADESGVDVSGLDVDFHVEKSLKATEPNTLRLQIYNLSESTRQALSGDHPLNVRLEAGYVGGRSQLYFAQARSAWTTRDGADFITHIESQDTVARPTGVHKAKKPQPGSKTGSLYVTMGARVPLKQAFQAIAGALGIKTGDLDAALANLKGQHLSSVNGAALMGNGAQRMTDLCRSAGLEWSVQDGVLQLINIGEALSTTQAVEVSEATGMIGSPSVDSQGAVSAKTLLIPGLAPGVLVKFDALFVSGGYRVDKIRYIGSTYGQDWYAEFDAVKY